jgi:hypothetical protein
MSIPLANYIQLIKNHKSPYYDVAEYLLKDMKRHCSSAGKDIEIVYTINPRILHDEMGQRVKNEKLTAVNVCRTILALFYGSKLCEEKDFYFTTTASGRRNYHVRVNAQTLRSISGFL